MKLVPKEIEAILPAPNSQENVPDPVALVKSFDGVLVLVCELVSVVVAVGVLRMKSSGRGALQSAVSASALQSAVYSSAWVGSLEPGQHPRCSHSRRGP